MALCLLAFVALSALAGMLLAERLMIRRHPETRKFWTWANYGTGTAIAAVAVRNWRLPAQPVAADTSVK